MLTLFHDFTSPASAVAVARLQRLADDGLTVEFAGFEAVGVDTPLPVTLDVLAAFGDLAAEAAEEGVILRRPTLLPPTGMAHLVGAIADAHGLGASWRQTAYRAFWEHGLDLGAAQVLIHLAADAGLDQAVVKGALADRQALARIRRTMAGHRRNGVGGVPTVLSQRTLVPGLLPAEDLRALAQLD